MRLARHPQNAPGPFYGTGGCTACGAPEAEAQELLAPLTATNDESYFVRQPATPAEVERACRALEVCCLGAFRYAGREPAVIRRLGNRPDFCDHLVAGPPVRLPWESDANFAAAVQHWRRSRRPWWRFW